MKVFNVIKNIIVIFLIVVFAFVILMISFGFKGHSVVTDSMSPTLKRGYAVFTKQIAFNDLQIGDIVTVKLGEGTTFTHRVVEIDYDKNEFYTKGDNSATIDGASKAGDIVGKVIFSLPLAGYLSILVSTRSSLALMFAVLIALIVILRILTVVISKKKGVTENE